jgi:hypothetical protein
MDMDEVVESVDRIGGACRMMISKKQQQQRMGARQEAMPYESWCAACRAVTEHRGGRCCHEIHDEEAAEAAAVVERAGHERRRLLR